MNELMKKLLILTLTVLASLMLAVPAFAAGEDAAPQTEAQTEILAEASTANWKAIASAVGIGIAAMGGALAMGMATGKAAESIGRQPEAEGKIRTTLMLGLVFIETAIIYALLVVILIIFVL